MKKAVCLILIMCCVFSCSMITAHAKDDEDVFFNDIPWKSTYKETVSVLKQKFDVEFVGADDLVSDSDLLSYLDTTYLKKMYGYTNDRVGFCVISTSPVQIAEENAYIFLRFVFANNGTEVLYDDYENAALIDATYLFCIEPAEESNIFTVNTFMERYSINKTDYSYNEKQNVYDKLETLIDQKYGDRLVSLDITSGVYVWQYHWTRTFNFRLNINGRNELCELNAIAVEYFTSDKSGVKENKEIIQKQEEEAGIAYRQKKTDDTLAIDSSGL